MERKKFGKIVAALRREQIDFSRGHSWSQQRLADEAGLTAPIIGKIERGQQARLDGEILHGLARAFQLTSFERREFFAMASEVTDEDIVRAGLDHTKVFAQVWALLDTLRAPAFLMDPFADLIGVNHALLAFHDMSATRLKAVQTTDAGVNNMALLLAPDARLRQLLGQSWHPIVLANATQWRAMTLRYRHTPRFRQIFSILSTYPEFQMFWAAGHDDERGNDDYSRLRSYVYTHTGRMGRWGTRSSPPQASAPMASSTSPPLCPRIASQTRFSTNWRTRTAAPWLSRPDRIPTWNDARAGFSHSQ